jgi:predicted transcriptional regulator
MKRPFAEIADKQNRRRAQNMIEECSIEVVRRELDLHKIGARMRRLREESDVSIRCMARHLEVSPPFLSDCELGRRNLGLERTQEFLAFCESVRRREKP